MKNKTEISVPNIILWEEKRQEQKGPLRPRCSFPPLSWAVMFIPFHITCPLSYSVGIITSPKQVEKSGCPCTAAVSTQHNLLSSMATKQKLGLRVRLK